MISHQVSPSAYVAIADVRAALKSLPDESIQMCVTSPPYWGLRDYGVPGQLGLEPTPDEYVANLVEIFREVRRVLRSDGTLWLNLGDSYAASSKGSGGTAKSAVGHGKGQGTNVGSFYGGRFDLDASGLKPKDLVGIPWLTAFALRADGWYLRSDIIWHKPNPMPESVRDRPTKAHEYLFLLAKTDRYYYDINAIREPYKDPVDAKRRQDKGEVAGPLDLGMTHGRAGGHPNGRNRRTVWTIAPKAYKGAHFATFPPALVEPCIKAGSPVGGIVLDPFVGSGTTLQVAAVLGRRSIGIELNPDYLPLIVERCSLPDTPAASAASVSGSSEAA